MAFQPVGPGESVYQTVQLSNSSDTPVLFKVLQDSTNTFRAFPALGLVPGKSFALVVFEFNPKHARFYNFAAQLLFNNSTSNIQAVQLMGYCYAPQLSIPQDKLFFPPTYVGVSQKQPFVVKNNSRIPLEYEWKVPDKYRHEVNFMPPRAMLLPNEETKVMATFTALKKKEYDVTVPIYARNMNELAKNSVGFFKPGSGLGHGMGASFTNFGIQTIRKDISIIGAGSDGAIEISPKELDFGTITVGFSKTFSVIIYNKSNCNLYIELKMMQDLGSSENGGP